MPDAPHRVFNRNDHPSYGASRRLWVVMATLFPDQDLLDRVYAQHNGYTWDCHLAEMLGAGETEEIAARTVVAIALDEYPD